MFKKVVLGVVLSALLVFSSTVELYQVMVEFLLLVFQENLQEKVTAKLFLCCLEIQ